MGPAAAIANVTIGGGIFRPAPLAPIHPRWKTPHIAIAIQAVLMCVLAITSGFDALAIIANVAALLVYMACAMAS